MQMLIDDYGQAVVLIVFGAGIIILMGMLLGHIVSGKVYLKEFTAMSGLQRRVQSDNVDIIRGDTDRDKTFTDIDLFEYRGKEHSDSDR